MFDKIKNAASNLGDIGAMGDLQDHLEGLSFPADKDQILAQLRQGGAQDELLAKVGEIGKQHFESQTDFLTSFMSER